MKSRGPEAHAVFRYGTASHYAKPRRLKPAALLCCGALVRNIAISNARRNREGGLLLLSPRQLIGQDPSDGGVEEWFDRRNSGLLG